jgi:hypothetical protein
MTNWWFLAGHSLVSFGVGCVASLAGLLLMMRETSHQKSFGKIKVSEKTFQYVARQATISGIITIISGYNHAAISGAVMSLLMTASFYFSYPSSYMTVNYLIGSVLITALNGLMWYRDAKREVEEMEKKEKEEEI